MVELNPSQLGTKEHWDEVYAEELKNFEELGDEGEIWFGQDTVDKMVNWCLKNVPPSSDYRILEVGCGNATLLFALVEAGYSPQSLKGIDYSSDSIQLSKHIARSRGVEGLNLEVLDFLTQELSDTPDEGGWDVLLDKGTYDAIALGSKDHNTGKSPAAQYPGRVKRLLKPNGHFLITSCNFTEDELKSTFASSENGLQYHSRIQHPTFSFAGASGSTCSSVAFCRS